MENFKIIYKLKIKYDLFYVKLKNGEIIENLAIPGVISATKKITKTVIIRIANFLKINPDEIEKIIFLKNEYRYYNLDFTTAEDRLFLKYLERKKYNV